MKFILVYLFSINSVFALPPSSFYWQLQGEIKKDMPALVYDIDLEDHEHGSLIKELHQKGKIVMCYFSGGTFEDWRVDKTLFDKKDIGKPLDEWPGERWLNIRSKKVRDSMLSRLMRAKNAGCDGVEPDNMDAYAFKTGFSITRRDQLDYLDYMSNAAHTLGLSIGLKNAVDLIEPGKLYEKFDWALNEQCYQYKECGVYKSFVSAGKAVVVAEYEDKSVKFCADAKKNKFFLAIFSLTLNGTKYKTCP